MKLVKFDCTVSKRRAERNEEDAVEVHPIWINPDDVQMVAPARRDEPDTVEIIFSNQGGSTSVAGTFEKVISKLTTA